jgi:putative endonuclease
LEVDRRYFVYILASRSRTIYVGVTRSLKKRVPEHREGRAPGFTARYRIYRLVYFETYRDAHAAINRGKELKTWRRERKVALIEERNPTWADLAEAWFAPYPSKKQIPHP